MQTGECAVHAPNTDGTWADVDYPFPRGPTRITLEYESAAPFDGTNPASYAAAAASQGARVILEFCCGPESLLGKPWPESQGCKRHYIHGVLTHIALLLRR